MSKHTPGPWPEPEYDNSDTSASEWWGIAGIARVWGEADARLIAAAPELLRAANEAVFYMEGGSDHAICHAGICSRDQCGQCQRVDALRAAIAKAEGRSE